MHAGPADGPLDRWSVGPVVRWAMWSNGKVYIHAYLGVLTRGLDRAHEAEPGYNGVVVGVHHQQRRLDLRQPLVARRGRVVVIHASVAVLSPRERLVDITDAQCGARQLLVDLERGGWWVVSGGRVKELAGSECLP